MMVVSRSDNGRREGEKRAESRERGKALRQIETQKTETCAGHCRDTILPRIDHLSIPFSTGCFLTTWESFYFHLCLRCLLCSLICCVGWWCPRTRGTRWFRSISGHDKDSQFSTCYLWSNQDLWGQVAFVMVSSLWSHINSNHNRCFG